MHRPILAIVISAVLLLVSFHFASSDVTHNAQEIIAGELGETYPGDWSFTNGNVGIGTLTPSSQLDLVGDMEISDGNSIFSPGTGSTINIGDNDHVIVNGDQLYINHTFTYIGINTSAPNMELTVDGHVNVTGDIYVDDVHASGQSVYLDDKALSNQGGTLLWGNNQLTTNATTYVAKMGITVTAFGSASGTVHYCDFDVVHGTTLCNANTAVKYFDTNVNWPSANESFVLPGLTEASYWMGRTADELIGVWYTDAGRYNETIIRVNITWAGQGAWAAPDSTGTAEADAMAIKIG